MTGKALKKIVRTVDSVGRTVQRVARPPKAKPSLSVMLTDAANLDDTIELLMAERFDILNQWGALACPLAVGDLIECPCYSHKGKRCRVTDVGWRQTSRRVVVWVVTVRLFKKNGADSLHFVSFDQRDFDAYNKTKGLCGAIRLEV